MDSLRFLKPDNHVRSFPIALQTSLFREEHGQRRGSDGGHGKSGTRLKQRISKDLKDRLESEQPQQALFGFK